MKFDTARTEIAIEEIKKAIKKIERDNSLKTVLFFGLGLAAVFMVLLLIVIKIKEKAGRKRRYFADADDFYDDDDVDFNSYSLFDDDDDDDYKYEYFDDDYDDMEDLSFDGDVTNSDFDDDLGDE